MSPTEGRRWLLVGAAALGLRVGAAVLTEFSPIFPSHYYHDAVLAESLGAEMAGSWREGRIHASRYAPPHRIHAAFIAAVYIPFGRRPLAAKIVNALIGSASVLLIGFAAAAATTPAAGLAAAAAVAVWPSHVFYTSQNFKESPSLALLFGALALAASMLSREDDGRTGAAKAAGFVALSVGAGLFRSYVLVVLCAAAFFAAALKARRSSSARMLLAAVLAAPFAYKACSRAVLRHAIPAVEYAKDNAEANFLSVARDENGLARKPSFSPAEISEFRRGRQESDRRYAREKGGREIATQIYPDAVFKSWGDIVLFLPKAAFAVLFMPLPGLYPMDGRIGRMLAAAENVILLLAFVAALSRGPRALGAPAALLLAAFFAAMTAGSALLEFDLGSASRHKLQYFPAILPFAAEAILRRRRS
ncbi:MAG: hypothetical protein M0D55_17375 [Elusimicrobiota bacterium]|nr:MAG: hypothetical protein M0D55_17375 [Elusimicrobiota bacterium]